jgi:Ricin-type beta-trefoil lectin domain
MPIRLLTKVLAPVAAGAVALIGLGVPAASAATIAPLRNDNSHLCLGIDANRYAVQWSCNGNADQLWHWANYDPWKMGYQQVVNNAGQCLGVDGMSGSQGARVRGWSCNGNMDQYWAPAYYPQPDGSIAIKNLYSGMVVAIYGASTAVGASVVQWPYQGHPDQRWY